jgi:hypothetical protein
MPDFQRRKDIQQDNNRPLATNPGRFLPQIAMPAAEEMEMHIGPAPFSNLLEYDL